jgi:uncharacterized protein YkwD
VRSSISIPIPTRRRRLAAALAAGSIALLLLPMAPARATSEPEAQMRHLINAERSEQGKRPLPMSARMSGIAERHTREMAESGTIYHNDDLGSDLRYCHPSRWGENVGMGGSVTRLHDLFMDSAPHRKNVLNGTFDRIGVGVVSRHGTTYVTVVFVAN